MSRDICKVIEQMIAVIPETEVKFVEDLKWAKINASYKPPEQQRECFDVTGAMLGKHIGPNPTLDWEKLIVNIWMDKTIFIIVQEAT